MTRSMRSIVALVALLAVALTTWRGVVLAGAADSATHARAQLAAVAVQGQDVLELRSKRPTTGMGPKPAEDLAKLLGGVMKECGLPEARLRAVSPDVEAKLASDPSWPGVTRRRQSARVSLEPLTPGELGVLLRRWRASQSVWCVTAVELSHIASNGHGGGGGSSGAAGEAAFRVSLSLAATYVDGPKRP